jgi:hypothetical protein
MVFEVNYMHYLSTKIYKLSPPCVVPAMLHDLSLFSQFSRLSPLISAISAQRSAHFINAL